MPRLQNAERLLVIKFRDQGLGFGAIVKKLKERNIRVSKSGAWSICKVFISVILFLHEQDNFFTRFSSVVRKILLFYYFQLNLFSPEVCQYGISRYKDAVWREKKSLCTT